MNFATEKEGNIVQYLKEDSKRENRGDENEDDGNQDGHSHSHREENESNQRESQFFMRSKGNTGVKGVLADAASARELERVEREMERMKMEYRMNKMSIKVDPNSKTQFSSHNEEERDEKREEDEDIDKLLDDEDDEFFQQYKKQQMQQLRQQKTFGFLSNITQAEFVSAIDDEDPRVSVVIHFYEDWHGGCVKLNKLLSNLAMKLTTVKFLKIRSLEASDTFEEIALPAISIYRGGNLVSAQLRVNESLPPAYDSDHLEAFLAEFGVTQRT